MKKLIGAAIAASATVAGVGIANAGEISANVAFTSDYVFRGVSLSGEDPAVQGGVDWTSDQFYVGTWGSSLGSAGTSMELDLYAGWTPSTGPVSWDLGLIGYFYPGADDAGAEFDYYEGKLAASFHPVESGTLGAAVYYSPENFGETGNAVYYEVNGEYDFNDAWKVTGAIGQQSIDDVDGPGGANVDDDYMTWNLGVTHAFHGFEIDLRYTEADIDDSDPIALAGYASEATAEGRGVITISREL
jgi:uncharacterized protein (TIGR02001 family)